MSSQHRFLGRPVGGPLLALAAAAALLPIGVTSGPVAAADALVLAETHADASDFEWDQGSEVNVDLADGVSSGGDGVEIEGDVVTIAAGGTYRLSGSLSDGQVVVDAGDEDLVRLVLDGISIESSTTAPLSATAADRLVIVLAEGSSNVLGDAEGYDYPSEDTGEPNAALFSDVDMTIGGGGSLSVTGRFNDGIASKDGLVISGGSIDVTAADDGIRGKDYLVIEDGIITVDAAGDALTSDEEEDATLGWIRIGGGDLSLTSGKDAIEGFTAVIIDDGTMAIEAGDDAIHSERRVEVHGGSVDISTSVEGLEGTEIVVDGGDVTVVSTDDAVNVAGESEAAGTMPDPGTMPEPPAAGDPDAPPQGDPGTRPAGDPGVPPQRGPGRGPGGPGGGGAFPGEAAIEGWYLDVSGGTLVLDAGGDGIDSNGSATISGGTIVVDGPTVDMNGAIDVAGELVVSGGTLVASGSAGMAEAPDTGSSQPSLEIRTDSVVEAGTVVRIQSTGSTPVVTYAASKPWASLVVSTPDLVAGETYEVLLGGSASGEQAGGLYLDPTYGPGTSVGTVTAA
jgi:hypothetical protein